MGVCFIDTETTGLDPQKNVIWEVGLIDAEAEEHVWMVDLTSAELRDADPFSLSIGHFHERHPRGFMVQQPKDDGEAAARGWKAVPLFPIFGGTLASGAVQSYGAYSLVDVAREVARLTWGHHLAGSVPSFDEERLRSLCRQHAIPYNWYYQFIDVEALAVGYLAGCISRSNKGKNPGDNPAAVLPDLPWDSRELSAQLGVNMDGFVVHEALEDARWARAIWCAIMRNQNGCL